MKTRFLAFVVVAALPLMAFNCITDSFTIALNLKPFNGTYNLISGSNTTYGGSFTVNPSSLYDSQKYTLDGASVYDIRISTAGTPDLGTVRGVITITSSLVTKQLLTYGGTSVKWSNFYTPQSLITSPYIQRTQEGVDSLVSWVVQGKSITFTVSGTVASAPATSGYSITSTAYVQAFARTN